MPDGIVMVDGAGRIVLANTQAELLFGYGTDELRGLPIEALLPARFHGSHVTRRTRYFAHPRLRKMGVGLDLFGLRKDGVEFPVEISLGPVETEIGQLVISAIRDISERRRAEQALLEKNVELELASRSKDNFLATMSHELRTPLNAIIGFTGTLLMRLPGPLLPEQERQLRTVQSSARHLLSLINDLLDLAKIDSGKVDLLLEATPCRPVVEEVIASLKPAAEAKGLRLDIELPATEIVLRTDRRALSQILLNFVNNAVKFTERGHVAVALRERVEDRGRVTEFSVVDTGIGIAAADQQSLFLAFTQVGDKSRRHEGTGLGLHLSRKLAELLGATIEFDSEPGTGSRFSLLFEEP